MAMIDRDVHCTNSPERLLGPEVVEFEVVRHELAPRAEPLHGVAVDGRARERGEVYAGVGLDSIDHHLGRGRVAQIERAEKQRLLPIAMKKPSRLKEASESADVATPPPIGNKLRKTSGVTVSPGRQTTLKRPRPNSPRVGTSVANAKPSCNSEWGTQRRPSSWPPAR